MTILVVLALMLTGCEAKELPSEPANLTLSTVLSGEEDVVDYEQEHRGRVIVMLARGWSAWPVITGGYDCPKASCTMEERAEMEGKP